VATTVRSGAAQITGGAESVGVSAGVGSAQLPTPGPEGDRLGDRHAGGVGAGGKRHCALLGQLTAVDRENAEGVDSALIDV
jgi:hypothetical protein